MTKPLLTIVVSSLVFLLILAPPAPAQQIANGSFETGDLTGWGSTDLLNLIYPSSLLVNLPGFVQGPPLPMPLLFPIGSFPSDGIYSFQAFSFSPGPATPINIFQDLVIPENATFLAFRYHGSWDFLSFGTFTPGVFDVQIQPFGGGPPFVVTPLIFAPPGTYVPDTGLTGATVDLSAFRTVPSRVVLQLTPAAPQPAPFIVDVDAVTILTAPIVKGFFPTNAAKDIHLNQPISVTFSTNILPGTINSNSFQVRGELGQSYTGVYSVSSNVVTFTPGTSYKHGDLITVTVNSNLTDTAPTPLLFPHTFQFFAEAEGCCFGQFAFSTNQILGDAGIDVDLGDLNGDGRVDAFVTGFGNPNIVYLNAGNGLFLTNQFLVGANPQRTDLGDLDGDGDLDAFVAENGAPDQVYLNDGSGIFITNQSLGSTEFSVGVDLGDLDGDGDLDALVTSGGPDLVYLNNGSGTFTTNQALSFSAGFGVDLGDLDADGDLDALVADAGGSDLVYLNNGDGTFITNAFLSPLANWDVDLGDLDCDGDLDAMVAGNSGSSIVYSNIGNGTFDVFQSLTFAAGAGTELGDLDGDGDLDAIVVANGGDSAACVNDGHGLFTTNQLFGIPGFAGVDLADLDGDGDLDAFVAGIPNAVYLNDALCFRVTNTIPAHAAFDISEQSDARVFFNDEQNNSTVDAATFKIWGKLSGFYTGIYTFGSAAAALKPFPEFRPGEDVQVMLNGAINSTSGLPLKAHTYQFQVETRGCDTFIYQDNGQSLDPDYGYGLALGDVDGDGDVDAFIANGGDVTPRPNSLWLNQGDGTFVDSGQAMGFNSSMAVKFGDLDSDGDLDAFVANNYGEGDQVWTNDGSGIFYDSGQSLGFDSSRGVDLGDLDGDGDLDAYVANGDGFASQSDKVYLNDGSGAFTDSGQFLGFFDNHNVTLGDVDGDGDLDAFVVGGVFSSSPKTIRLNDGQGVFTDSGQMLGVFDTSWGVALGDLDGDGDLDAFVASWNSSQDRVYLNDGYGIFSDSGQTMGIGFGLSVALGDVDGDDDLDAFVANYGPNPSELFLNDGLGMFSNSGQVIGNDDSYGVALADLDGNGTLDAFVANNGFASPQDKVYLNKLDLTLNPIFIASGSPVVTGDPAGGDQNFIGDNFDLNTAGGTAQTMDQCGFGLFGDVYLNYDATNLYLGGTNLNVAGNNNAVILFLGMNTLSDNATNLSTFSGTPNGVGIMNNLSFIPPMDLAILMGDEYGDGNYFNFGLEGGADVGQGVYYMPSGAGAFFAVPDARLSQFDGTGKVATISTDDDPPNRQTDRWEVCIPWSNINAAGIGSISNLLISGVLVGGDSGGNRYLSGNYLGRVANSAGEFDGGMNFAFSNVILQARTVQLPYEDYDGDGMPNGFELDFGLTPTNPADATADGDTDTFNNLEEYISGTIPTNGVSYLKIDYTAYYNDGFNAGQLVEYNQVSGRVYRIEGRPWLAVPPDWFEQLVYTSDYDGVSSLLFLPGGFTNFSLRLKVNLP